MERLPFAAELAGPTAYAASLLELLMRPVRNREERLNLEAVASSAPEQFISTALALLRSADNKATRRTMYSNLLDHTGFLIELARPDRFRREQALAVCRELMTIDSLFDLHLARLLPRRYAHDCPLDMAGAARVLDLLHEISSGPRLILVLSHLTRHPDQQIASKATLLIARRIQNNQSVENYLKSTDPRVRANTVEALWNVQTTFARRTMKACLRDENNRVVGNALFGLHLLGDAEVKELADGMLRDRRPGFRQTAAWLMGQIGNSDFRPSLLLALQDAETGVRQAARRALKAIRDCTLAAIQPTTVETLPLAATEAATPEDAVSEDAAPEAEAAAPAALEAEKPVGTPSDESEPAKGSSDRNAETQPKAEEAPELPEQPPQYDFDIRLDGSYTTRRKR